MHSQFFTLASLLLGSAVALNNLKVRQGDAPDEAFKPGSSSALGATCEDAWGAGFISCGTGNECYNPALGESCCQDTYACGTGSFCLTDGWCCPDGIDPETCAKNNDVPWPIVAAAAAPASSSSAAPSSADPTTPAAPDYTPAYSPAYSAPVYSSPAAYPSPAPSYESHATTTYATSVGTITICPSSSKTANGTIPTYAPTKPPAFTGAASPQNVAGSAVALIGFLGFLQNLL
jgi:hypothetical protein